MSNFIKTMVTVVGSVVVTVAIAVAVVFWMASRGWFAPKMEKRDSFGTFSADPETKWLEDGRKMMLLADFVYIDPYNKAWIAPKNSKVDGASIPPAFWSLIGGPLEGQYRNASIVHDIACDTKKEPSVQVHEMFYYACRCGGVSEAKAKLLFTAVYHFGPSWIINSVTEVRTITAPDGVRKTETVVVERSEEIARDTAVDAEMASKLEAYIKAKNPSLEELQALDLNTL